MRSLFSACNPATTCIGEKKECKGGVCKCKNGYKEDPAIENPEGNDDCVLEDAGGKNCIVLDRFFLNSNLSLFSACDPATTCTGEKKECNGGVCKCKNGYQEDPAILNPDGKDDCVLKDGRKLYCLGQIISFSLFLNDRSHG